MPYNNEVKINILGAGLAGLSAALELSRKGRRVRLISAQTSERAQSNLAEGGINACLNVMGENDTVEEHFEDTIKGGCSIADPNMVWGLCSAAPEIVKELNLLGVPFNRENSHIVQRNFGGQKKKRTAFVQSSTGKMLMSALTDEARRFEAEGLIERFSHHELRALLFNEKNECTGLRVKDTYTGEKIDFVGSVIVAAGGLNGMFSGRTTGTVANTGDACAILLSQGVELSNLEFIQYHPTTVSIEGKRLLISEAARGEGGRLFYFDETGNNKVYFMEEKYGERGNLMPRDVVSRAMAAVSKNIFLDLTGLSGEIWEKRLSDLRKEIIEYLSIDPAKEYVPVSSGIHFFMGGIRVDASHRTNIENLYAAGECACAYHGANRLGGNSLLAAIYGGKIAAKSATQDFKEELFKRTDNSDRTGLENGYSESLSLDKEREMQEILAGALGVIRSEKSLSDAMERLKSLRGQDKSSRLLLAEAMILSAYERKESRGAHLMEEYPGTEAEFEKTSHVSFDGEKLNISFEEIPIFKGKPDEEDI